jgi:DNA processing protein
MNAPLADAELLARLRLIRAGAIGPVTFWALMQRFGTARAVEALPALSEVTTRDHCRPCKTPNANATPSRNTAHAL